MAIIVEDGTGIKSANAYGDSVEFKAYHADRGNSFSGGGGDIDKALIRATDYIDSRFGLRFKGARCFLNLNVARATLSFTQQPLDTETVVIGGTTYTFQTALVDVADNVLIGANVSESLGNLVRAITDGGEAGVNYGTGTVKNPDVASNEITGDRILVSSNLVGTPGNGFATTTTVSGATWNFAVTSGGGDDNTGQPLAFPRRSLFDRDGQIVIGIPDKLKDATFEYALRSLTAALNPDPTFDGSGRVIKREKVKVGPIETDTEFEDNGQIQLRSYPVADALLAEYLLPGGGVMR